MQLNQLIHSELVKKEIINVFWIVTPWLKWGIGSSISCVRKISRKTIISYLLISCICPKCNFSFSTNKTDSSKYLKVMLRATVIEHYTTEKRFPSQSKYFFGGEWNMLRPTATMIMHRMIWYTYLKYSHFNELKRVVKNRKVTQ